VIAATEQIGTYLESFTEFHKRAPGKDQPWLRELREKAFGRFCETGFPTTHDEDWRFTNVAPIAKISFRLAAGEKLPGVEQVEPFFVHGAACQLVFVNGRFAEPLSSIGNLPAGVRVSSLAAEISLNPAALESNLGRYLNIDRDAFSALNTAFLEDGAFVHIRRGTVIYDPICFLYVSTSGEAPLMSHPRNLIVAENETQPPSSKTTFLSAKVRLSVTPRPNLSQEIMPPFRIT